MASIFFWASLLGSTKAIETKDGSGRLPTLGWNTWNAYHCDIDAGKVLDAAKGLKSTGLQNSGYEYVVIDDCWSIQSGRNDFGFIAENPDKFPDGMKSLVDEIHSMNFKAGIYSSAGYTTCGGYPASLGFEENDASEFAGWGIDFLKYDNCGVPSEWADQYIYCNPDYDTTTSNGTCTTDLDPNLAPSGYDWTTSKSYERYSRMADAIAKQDHVMILNMCIWGQADVYSWGPKVGVSWRMSDDIQGSWGDVTRIINENIFHLEAVNFFARNDMDMLEVGNGLSAAEERSHFAIWAAMKSPLVIGTDVSQLSTDQISLLKNKYLLAFNQDDQYGGPAVPYKWGTNADWTFDNDHPAEYYAGPSKSGVLVLMLNTQDETQSKTADWSEIPGLGGSKYQVTNVWTGEDLGCMTSYTADVASHDTAVVLVGAAC